MLLKCTDVCCGCTSCLNLYSSAEALQSSPPTSVSSMISLSPPLAVQQYRCDLLDHLHCLEDFSLSCEGVDWAPLGCLTLPPKFPLHPPCRSLVTLQPSSLRQHLRIMKSVMEGWELWCCDLKMGVQCCWRRKKDKGSFDGVWFLLL